MSGCGDTACGTYPGDAVVVLVGAGDTTEDGDEVGDGVGVGVALAVGLTVRDGCGEVTVGFGLVVGVADGV
ncbi:MAG: hypothetical protein ABSA53_16875 [Streptosporangiaceae bacterium]